VQGFTSPNRVFLQQVHEYLNQTSIGHVDIIGCFHLPTKNFHVDPFQEDQLSFFKKITYPEKLKEIHDSYIFALELLREISEVEYEKFRIEGVYLKVAKTILNWQCLEREQDFKAYVEGIGNEYSLFNHPLPEYFQ